LFSASPAIVQADTSLDFNDEGVFKIMVIADIQDGVDVSAYTLKLMRLAIAQEDPDLIVLDGDNVFRLSPSLFFRGDNAKQSISEFMEPIVEADIPFAVVFGNQDHVRVFPLSDQMEFYRTFPGCVATLGQIGMRIGNYNLLVDDTGGKPALNLWFFDSGEMMWTRFGYGYEYVTTEQIEWYEQTARDLAEKNDGSPLPAVVFQHIPVIQIYDVLTAVPKDTPDAIRGAYSRRGEFFVPDPTKVISGQMNAAPTAPDIDNGQFASWLAQGDVMAAVFGHAHVNDFVGMLDGISLMYTPGVGFYAYGNGTRRGVRILEFDQDDVTTYSTRLVYWEDLTDEEIPADILYDGEFLHSSVWFYYGLVLIVFAGLICSLIWFFRRWGVRPFWRRGRNTA
jgi:hypothetical protein